MLAGAETVDYVLDQFAGLLKEASVDRHELPVAFRTSEVGRLSQPPVARWGHRALPTVGRA